VTSPSPAEPAASGQLGPVPSDYPACPSVPANHGDCPLLLGASRQAAAFPRQRCSARRVTACLCGSTLGDLPGRVLTSPRDRTRDPGANQCSVTCPAIVFLGVSVRGAPARGDSPIRPNSESSPVDVTCPGNTSHGDKAGLARPKLRRATTHLEASLPRCDDPSVAEPGPSDESTLAWPARGDCPTRCDESAHADAGHRDESTYSWPRRGDDSTPRLTLRPGATSRSHSTSPCASGLSDSARLASSISGPAAPTPRYATTRALSRPALATGQPLRAQTGPARRSSPAPRSAARQARPCRVDPSRIRATVLTGSTQCDESDHHRPVHGDKPRRHRTWRQANTSPDGAK
jgi:hypothetical protein